MNFVLNLNNPFVLIKKWPSADEISCLNKSCTKRSDNILR